MRGLNLAVTRAALKLSNFMGRLSCLLWGKVPFCPSPDVEMEKNKNKKQENLILANSIE